MITLTEGNGNSGGKDLATEDKKYIYIDTGPAQYTIRKTEFKLFEKVIELDLTDGELTELHKSADAVKSVMKVLDDMNLF